MRETVRESERERAYLWARLALLSLAVAPFCLLYFSGYTFLTLSVLTLNFFGWIIAHLFYDSLIHFGRAISQSSAKLELSSVPGGVVRRFQHFLYEIQRFHRAGNAADLANYLEKEDSSQSLQQLLQLAYDEFRAQAVELALFDESSGAWSQSLMIGVPKTAQAQEMLSDHNRAGETITPRGVRIIRSPLSFAGTFFGTLRVEFRPGYPALPSDKQIVSLYAKQAALLLVNVRFTEEIVRLREKSEESVRAKTGFLANLSHEIRGPLGSILNGLELILEGLCGPIEQQVRETCEIIQKSAKHLLDLVNDVLDYAKVEAGKISANPVTLPLKALLSDLSSVVRAEAVAKNHKLVLEPVEEKLALSCDKRHARQMIINLLTNAIKYTPDGGTITLRGEHFRDNRVKISVSDTGVGIPASERSKVFGAFERVENKYSLSQRGTGLGMSLTKDLVELNGGTVDFESNEGEGSTFWLILPAEELSEELPISTALGDEELSPQGKGESILLVSKDKNESEMMERYLVHQGFHLMTANNAPEVMKVLREITPQLAVVEGDASEDSGDELVSLIRANPKTQDIPIIFVSPKAFVFDIERYLKIGVDRCLSKPVQLRELALTARQLLLSSSGERKQTGKE